MNRTPYCARLPHGTVFFYRMKVIFLDSSSWHDKETFVGSRLEAHRQLLLRRFSVTELG
jgi:hypothetical protein